jgi:hypothetical protein
MKPSSLVSASTSVAFAEAGEGTELSLALRTGERTKTGVYVHLTPVVDAELGCTLGSLGAGVVVDEPDEPEFVQWDGRRYGLAEGDTGVQATVYKVFDGNPGTLTVDEANLEITSTGSWLGIIKLVKNRQSLRYLWTPPNIDEESEAMVWAFYEGRTGTDGRNVTKTAEALLKKSMALTTVQWPPEEDKYPISLSVGRQDNENQCIYVYQTPNQSAVERGTDVGMIQDVGTVNTKEKDIFTVWDGASLSLPSGVVSCQVSVYRVYQGTPGGIRVDLANEQCTSGNEWLGIVKLTTVVESRKLKWIPPDPTKRTQAVVHAYRRGSVAMTNLEWVPNEEELELRVELDSSESKEQSRLPMMEILLRLYPANPEITIGCTEGGLGRGQVIREQKEKVLEFQLAPLPEIGKLEDSAWEPDDEIDATDVSKVALGKSCLEVSFEVIDCFNRNGESVYPVVTFDPESGNAVGDQSFYGLVKAIYKEEYQQLLYQQAYRIDANGAMNLLTGYVYAFYNNKAAFCEVPWDTNLKTDRKTLYEVFSYFVADKNGTWEYPDNWLDELKREKDLRQWTRDEWEDVIESREPGTFTIDPSAEIHPSNNSIQERIHRTVNYDWLGTIHTENQQPVRGHYYKPYTTVKPSPTASYKPQYFVRFAGKPEVFDNISEFGDQEPSFEPEVVGKLPRYIPTNESLESLKKAWESAYSKFKFDKIYDELKKEYPGLIRVPDVQDEE